MKSQFHIVDRFDVPWAGGVLESAENYDLLVGHAEVTLWSPFPQHESYGREVSTITDAQFPSGGTLILAVGEWTPGDWLERGQFSRIILRFNNPASFGTLFEWIGRIRGAAAIDPEFVFPSLMLKKWAGLEGLIEASPIDLADFVPTGEKPSQPFTVGRVSRDIEIKHHEDDPSLYRMLALRGYQTRIMGGTCLRPYIGVDSTGIELLPAGAEPAGRFLSNLDCFFYRTYPSWFEAFGRVIVEAMACGLAVVCERRGGYIEFIRNGENGFLFDTQEEAYECILKLASAPELRAEIGAEARRTVQDMYHARHRLKCLAWYLGK